jgi:hypothetical protein
LNFLFKRLFFDYFRKLIPEYPILKYLQEHLKVGQEKKDRNKRKIEEILRYEAASNEYYNNKVCKNE